MTPRELLDRYIDRGAHPEYKAFEARITGSGGQKRASDVWKFIDDAVTGAGGFSNGEYIFPHVAEVENNLLSSKLARRMVQADYDRFAEHVCNAPWDLIVSGSDMIERKAEGAAEQLLAEFWADVDNRGTSMMDFLEYPFGQARRYPVGWILMDRPDVPIETEAENKARENRPYVYGVPTRDVVDWKFDEDGNLVAIAVLEPPEDHESSEPPPIRIWTLESWALFVPTDKTGKEYAVKQEAPNKLKMVPAIPLWTDAPPSGRAFGYSEMLEVARLAQTVYNIDSEARDVERKCAIILAIPVKNTSDYDGGKITIGNDAALVYEAGAGEPHYIAPDLGILDQYEKSRTRKKDAAYEMAHLRALNPSAATVETTSGFHAEVEFQKTERRVARHAAMLERTEKLLAILYLRFYGIDDDSLFTITYPRDFGVRDVQQMIDDVKKLRELNLGETSERAELSKLFRARHPRKADAEIAVMVDEAIEANKNAAKQASAIDRIKEMASKARGGAARLRPQESTSSGPRDGDGDGIINET